MTLHFMTLHGSWATYRHLIELIRQRSLDLRLTETFILEWSRFQKIFLIWWCLIWTIRPRERGKEHLFERMLVAHRRGLSWMIGELWLIKDVWWNDVCTIPRYQKFSKEMLIAIKILSSSNLFLYILVILFLGVPSEVGRPKTVFIWTLYENVFVRGTGWTSNFWSVSITAARYSSLFSLFFDVVGSSVGIPRPHLPHHSGE